MAIASLEDINTTGQPGGSTMLDRLWDKLVKFSFSLRNVVLNDVLVTVTLTTVPQQVRHGLGHVPIAWDIVDINANQIPWRTAPADDQYITLAATGTVTVTIRFT